MLGIERIFSKNMWRTFGYRLIETVFRKDSFFHDFGFGYRDVKDIAKYYKEKNTREVLQKLIDDNKLVGKTEKETVFKCMKWLNDTYPSNHYYMKDHGDRWNTPLETLQSWQNRSAMNSFVPWYSEHDREWYNEMPTDCDDYAVFLYNLMRVAGVAKENLRLCFMKTETEWHMNAMYLDTGSIPYAIEGTYHPEVAIRNFGNITYYENRTFDGTTWVNYYAGIRWVFNEDEVRRSVYE